MKITNDHLRVVRNAILSAPSLPLQDAILLREIHNELAIMMLNREYNEAQQAR